jgi:hypothetical protein
VVKTGRLTMGVKPRVLVMTCLSRILYYKRREQREPEHHYLGYANSWLS